MSLYSPRHDICQQIYATAVFGPKKLRKKSINRDKIKSATKQRKCPKIAILRHLGVVMDNWHFIFNFLALKWPFFNTKVLIWPFFTHFAKNSIGNLRCLLKNLRSLQKFYATAGCTGCDKYHVCIRLVFVITRCHVNVIFETLLSENNNFGDCPSLTPRFALLTQSQESYNTKLSIYLESMLMQCYGNYICKIAFVVLWLSTYFALFFKWGRMSITDVLKLTIPQKSI